VAGVALFYDLTKDGRASNAHIGVFGLGDRPQRLRAAESAISGRVVEGMTIEQVAAAASAEVEPHDDIHASAGYRRALVGTLVERALARAAR
jgi:carbon-monoxide dehydrogenase medium subunit